MSKDNPKKDFGSMAQSEIKSLLVSLRSTIALERLKLRNAPAGADLSVFRKAKKDVARSLTALRKSVNGFGIVRS